MALPAGRAYIDQEVLPWINDQGKLIPATGSAADKPAGAPPGPPGSGGGGDSGGGGGGAPSSSKSAEKHPVQPKSTQAPPTNIPGTYRPGHVARAGRAHPTAALGQVMHHGGGITAPATGASVEPRPKTSEHPSAGLRHLTHDPTRIAQGTSRAADTYHHWDPVAEAARGASGHHESLFSPHSVARAREVLGDIERAIGHVVHHPFDIFHSRDGRDRDGKMSAGLKSFAKSVPENREHARDIQEAYHHAQDLINPEAKLAEIRARGERLRSQWARPRGGGDPTVPGLAGDEPTFGGETHFGGGAIPEEASWGMGRRGGRRASWKRA
jgi:hypothetical protein